MKKTFKIETDCANCANLMEEETKKTKGVKDASINFMTQKIEIDFEENSDIKSVQKEILKNCKKIEPDCEIYF